MNSIDTSKNRHIGARIRDRRQSLALKQADVAAKAGVSASYLNLIEHNKRRIGGKLLMSIARALGTEPAALTDGPEAELYAALSEVASHTPAGASLPEADRIDAFAARFPGWAAAIAAQRQQIATLEGLNDALSDRLSHDQELADGIHELLSTVSAIRSTAAILAEDTNLDPQWRARFHRNLHEEAERLSGRATALARHFDEEVPGRARSEINPAEAVERLFERAGHHFPLIEAEGAAAISTVLAQADIPEGATRAVAEAALRRYADDAAKLPLAMFVPAAKAAAFEPERLYAQAGGDVACVLRRLAHLPPEAGAPEFGFACCNAAGSLGLRRRIASFSVPRFRPGCPLLPLYRAFGRPLVPEKSQVTLATGTILEAWSISQNCGSDAEGRPVMEATMLYRDAGKSDAQTTPPPGACGVCGGAGCDAGHMASVSASTWN